LAFFLNSCNSNLPDSGSQKKTENIVIILQPFEDFKESELDYVHKK
jgi:hypothetical protein